MQPSDYVRRGWTQYAYARNSAGREQWPRSPSAVSWDVAGAIYAAHPWNTRARLAITYTLTVFVGDDIEVWNDAPERTQSEVIAALKAIGA